MKKPGRIKRWVAAQAEVNGTLDKIQDRNRRRIGLPDLPEVRALSRAVFHGTFVEPGSLSAGEEARLKAAASRAVAWHEGLGPEWERMHLPDSAE